MADKNLEVNVIVNAKTKELDNLLKKLNKIEEEVKENASAQNKITTAVEKTNKAHKKTTSLVNSVTRAIRHLAGGYVALQAAQAAVTNSDMITSAENKFNAMNGGDEAMTQQTLDKIYTSSQKVRVGYADMMNNVGKSMTLASKAFGGNIDNAIRFQEIMGEAYTLGGASAQEMSSSMYQMIQALGSGKLSGDELRSVTEGAPMAAKEIEKFAQEIYKTDMALKDMGAKGMITSEIVVAAMMNAGDTIDKKFEDTSMTFAQAWTNMKNTAIKAFEPVLQKMNDLLNSENGKKVVEGISKAIMVVAQVANVIFTIFGAVFNWFVENWDWIKWIVLAVVIALTIHFGIMAGAAIAAGISAFISFMLALSPLTWLILAIGAVIAILAALGVSFSDVCGFIVGIVFWAGATVLNIFIGLINQIIQRLYSMFVEPVKSVVEWFVNAFSGGFDGVEGALKNALGQMLSMIIAWAKPVTKLFDAITGTDITGKLSDLQSTMRSWGKNGNAVTYSYEAPTIKRIDASNAFNVGQELGQSAGNWVTDKVSDIGSKLTNIGGSAINPTSPENMLKDIADADGDTANNTGKMADSMKLAEEDLAYLKDVANMEWKKEYTTASIKIDMTNNNTINDANDWEGWFSKLGEVLNEELAAQAEGVYSY